MKTPLIIANWKSHKTVEETKTFFSEIASLLIPHPQANVVLCPPFPLLSLCKELIQKYQLKWQLGAQDVSPFEPGKHTGEVNAIQLRDFVSHVLVGHSERRTEFHESDEMLFEKVKRVQEVGLTAIFFVQGEETPLPKSIEIVAYEPIFAIGTGNADTPEDAEKVAKYFLIEKHVSTVLYGGSVTDKNVAAFMSCSSISGIVPGQASLDPVGFAKLLHNA